MRPILIGVLVALIVAGGFAAVELGGSHVARTTLDETLAALPPGYTATHGGTGYDAITDTLTIHNVVLSRDGRKIGHADKVTLSGAHFAALRAVFEPDAYPQGRPAWTDRRPLLGNLAVDALDIEPDGPGSAPLTIRQIVLDGLSGRPFIRPPTPPNRSAPDFQADAGSALSFQAFNVAAIDLVDPAAGHFALSKIGIDGYDAGQSGGMRIEGMDFAATRIKVPVTFSLADIVLGAADLRPLLTALANSAGQDPRERQQALAAAYGESHLARIDVDGLALKISPGPRIGLTSMHAESKQMPDGVRDGTGALRGLSIAADDTTLPPESHLLMERFGTDRIVLDEDTAGAFNTESGHLNLQKLDMTLRDLAGLHMAASLDGFDRVAMRSTDPAVRRQAIGKITINHVALEYDDHSLIGRIIGTIAQARNVSPEDLLALAARPLMSLNMLVPDQPDAGAQVTSFLEHPHVLRITLDPPAPVSIEQLRTVPVPQRAHMLGLKISAS
jgi:hypothetical protein